MGVSSGSRGVSVFSDNELVDIGDLTPTNSNFIVGDGTTWVAETGATARTSLGLGASDTASFTGVTCSSAGNATVSAARSGGATVQIQAQSARAQIGTTSNHEIQLIVNGGSAMTIDTSGNLNLTAGVLQKSGTQVVGAQGAAVADASGGATVDAEARTALNDLLARVRTHGLIAT